MEAPSPHRWAGWLLLFGAGVAACGSSLAKGHCVTNTQCGGSEATACLMGLCLPRASGSNGLAIEVSPRLDSAFAPTEILDADLANPAVALHVESLVTIDGSAHDAAQLGQYASDGHVTAFVKSAIPGRDDLQLDADMAGFGFTLGVRQSLLDSEATLWILPSAKAVMQPPVRFSAVLGPSVTLEFPSADQLISLGGALLGPLEDPMVGFSAQARLVSTGEVVSNNSVTDDSGRFELKVAPGSIASADTSGVVVDLSPPGDGDAELPHFVSRAVPLTGKANATATFHMPAFGTPAPLVFTVRAGDGAMRPVADVTVKFRTEIASPPDGSAVYQREASTNANGEVAISLIPGTADQARVYQVTALPSPDSPYALKCLPSVSVTVVGSDVQQSPYSVTLLLDRKAALKGTIVDAEGSAAPALSVTATPISGTTECVDAQSSGPVSTTTNRSGAYSMLVNPGVYRIDVEPAVGAPYPRLTLDGSAAVTVTEDVSQDIALPAGGVVEGDVVASDDTALASATLRFYEVACAADTCSGDHRVPPILRAQTRSDAVGHFRAVVPLQ